MGPDSNFCNGCGSRRSVVVDGDSYEIPRIELEDTCKHVPLPTAVAVLQPGEALSSCTHRLQRIDDTSEAGSVGGLKVETAVAPTPRPDVATQLAIKSL